MDFNGYKDYLLSYLEEYRQAEKNELEKIQQLSESEKEDKGYAILDAIVVAQDDNFTELMVKRNFSKWRLGDKVICKEANKSNFMATVIENFADRIVLSDVKELQIGSLINLYSYESELSGIIIGAIKSVQEGGTGSNYLNILAGISTPKIASPLPINGDNNLCDGLNEKQKEAAERIFNRPSIYAIQGPPGTGKTNVLATIAQAYSRTGKSVLIISNSHQAVNNALNRIGENNIPTYKVGSSYRTQELSNRVVLCESMMEYKIKSNHSRRNRACNGDVLGMTLYGAIINMIIHNSDFTPAIVLVDEASQIPLVMGASIAKLGAGTVVFIGDEIQMPPIFPEGVQNHELSISVFEHLQNILPLELKTTLTTTYRMNKIICEYVSKKYYEPHGISLYSFDGVADRHVIDEELEKSVEEINVSSEGCLDFNESEAHKVIELAKHYMSLGLEVAIVSPYRKQVNCVLNEWNATGFDGELLIDTVERLQGQDVDVIIITMSCSDAAYFISQKDFLLNPNRLNVMISRAKQKVLIVKNEIINSSMF